MLIAPCSRIFCKTFGDARREARDRSSADHLRGERTAGVQSPAGRTSVRHRSRQADHPAVRARLRELAVIRRFGYLRLLALMRREGLVMNHKKFRPLYREERQVRRRGGRKRALGTTAPLAIARGANQR